MVEARNAKGDRFSCQEFRNCTFVWFDMRLPAPLLLGVVGRSREWHRYCLRISEQLPQNTKAEAKFSSYSVGSDRLFGATFDYNGATARPMMAVPVGSRVDPSLPGRTTTRLNHQSSKMLLPPFE